MADSSGAGGVSQRSFPTTRWTVLRTAQDPSASGYREALNDLAVLYWRPISAYFQLRWNRKPEEAADMTQDFFRSLCEREFLKGLSPEFGRFRSFVRAALDNFARTEHRWRNAQKRGGEAAYIPMDVAAHFQPGKDLPPDEVFLREWARSVLALAVDELERECASLGRSREFQVFRARDVEGAAGGTPSYSDLAATFGTSEIDVTNILYRTRQRLRELVLLRVRDTVDSDAEAEAELRELFGPSPG